MNSLGRMYLKTFLAEFVGTFLLVALGDGCIAQVVLYPESDTDFLSINIGYAVAAMLGGYVSNGISGGHLNPAVSLALAVVDETPWILVPFYMLGQYLGAFFGAIMVFLMYFGKTQEYFLINTSSLVFCNFRCFDKG